MGNNHSSTAMSTKSAISSYNSLQAEKRRQDELAIAQAAATQKSMDRMHLDKIVEIMKRNRQTILTRIVHGETTTYLPEFSCFTCEFMWNHRHLFAKAIDIVFGKKSGLRFVSSWRNADGEQQTSYIIY